MNEKTDETLLDQAFEENAEGNADSIADVIEQLTAERDEMRDRFMRTLADAENARKRGEKDRREAAKLRGAARRRGD